MKHLFSAIISSLGGRIKEGLLFLALVATTTLLAYDFQSGNLYYELTSDSTVMVTSKSASSPYNDGVTITSAVIPSSISYGGKTLAVTAIDRYAFRNCASLASVAIPTTVTSIGSDAFYGTSLYNNSSKWENDVLYIGDCLIEAKTTISGSYTIKSNTRLIAGSAFNGCSSLTAITIPENVEAIGTSCFQRCESLAKVFWNAKNCAHCYSDIFSLTSITSFIFGDYVEHIPGYLCNGLTLLTAITIPESVKTVGRYVFNNCYFLNSVVWNAKRCEDASGLFEDVYSQITSFKFGNNVQTIPAYLCFGMDKLQSITIPNSVVNIGRAAFNGCDSLKTVMIGNNVVEIGMTAFGGCSSIEHIEFGEQLQKIGYEAFWGCTSLSSVIVPETVTSVESGAFVNCTSLKSVVWKAKKCTTFEISPYHPFGGCSLSDFVFGDSVKYIPDYLCSRAKLQSITIPNGVTAIGCYAFSSCSSLTSITIKSETPPSLERGNFDGVTKSIPVYVPCGSEEAYKSATRWKEFSNIQEHEASYSISVNTQNAAMGSASVDKNTACGAQISATANEGYFFKQWSDGNTDNPRTLVLTRDTKLTVIFEQVLNIDSTYQIYYTSSDGSIVTPYKTDDFGANIISNTYENGQGVITFDAPVKRIGNSAFENCTSLTSIIIPDSVISIDGYAFNGCSSLTSVYIPEGVQDIGGKMTFAGCSSITKIDIPESVEAIGPGAFMGCISLTSITLPNEITTLEENVFANCTSLLSVTFGNNIKEIFHGAFQNCTSLVSITVPANVQNIFEEAFYNCTAITSITSLAITPPEVWSISAFTNVVKTIPVYVPCGSVDAYKSAYAWSEFTNIQEPLSEHSLVVNTQNSVMGSAKVEKNSACEAAQISATANDGYLFKQWSDGNTDNPRTLVLTQDTSLTAMFEQVLNIDSTYQIYYTSSDGNIITPKSLDAFGANLLSNIYQDSIGIITFDGVVTSIGDYAFEGSPLTSIIIPNGVTNIGNAAFTNCSSLISIKVEKGNAIYDSREDCNAIIQTATNTLIAGCQNTIIPNSVVQIDNSAFEGCSSLTNITIPNGVTSIGSYAFQNCSSLESIEIPNSMKYIGGKSAFAACTSLKSVLLPDSLLEIGPGAFGGCSSLESINIPNGIKTIEASTFFGCSSLTSIVIPNSVTRIWDSAFEGCSSLLSVEIGESVTTIENRAFLGCYSINTIYCYPVAPPEILFLSTFENCKATVYVPCQSVDAYKAAYGWRIFADSIQEPLLAYTISVSSQSNEMGEAKVVKNTYCEGAQISATANDGYFFKQWSDGNTDNPRTLLLTQDISLTAIFEQVLNIDSTYQIYYTSSDGNIVTPYKTDNFGANIISNTYENGQGVITFDAPVKRIGNSAFENCTSLTSIIIPDSVISIDGYAFNGCSSLTSVYIPEGVQYIGGKMTFAGCSSLKSIVLPNSIMEIGPGAFMGCSALTSVVLPDNITSIEESTFAQCSSIISVALGNNIKRIWEDVFADCTSLTTITLPANLEHVMDRAFKNCTSTTSITSLAITPPEVWSMSAFDNVNKTIPVYVPCGSVDAYKSAYAWSVFTNIQEPLSEYSLVVNTQNGVMGSAQVEKNTACEAARISATANDGYLFKQWSDGNTDNPRTLVLTQDTMLTAIFMAQLPIYKTFYDTICDHTRYLDTITNSFKYISSEDPSSLVWSDTIFSDIQDTIYTFIITPIVDPIAMTDSLLATIPHALPILIQGEKPNVDASVAAIKAYYAANDTKTTSDVVEVTWHNVDTIIPCDATTFSMYLHVYTVCEDDNPNHFPEPGNPGKLPEFIFNVEKRAVSTTEFNETICQGGAYLWPVNGQSYTQTGMYYDTLRTTNGCDEEIRILYLTVKNAEPVDLYKESCDSYTWNGEVYTESGDYTYRTTASNGCDSVVTLHLTINTSKTFEETIVACDSYTWNGQVYTESGDYTYRTTASNGCDSIVTLHLTINTSKTFEETVVACDSYTWNGEIYTESGDYTYRTTASNGCDSVVTLHLTINKSAVAEMEYATICNGETYTWNGAVYNQAGDYSVILNTAAGCDSIVSLKLTILPAMQTETQNLELCTSDLPYSWYGQTLTKSGTYTYIEQYAGYACDSIEHILNLQVHTLALPSSISLPIAVCGSSIDVSAATADIEAFIASEPTYAANATVTWQQQQAGVWTALSTQPLDGDQGEVIVRYMIISDCGVLESPEIEVPVEMPTPENSKDLDGVKSVSKYNNRIFLFHLNDFVKKYGWAPKPEQVIWYKVVGEIDTYGAPGNDMVVGIGHNYNLPDGSVIKGDYYALVIQDSPNNDGCTSVYRTVLLTATQDENNSPALVPNVVQPNAQLSLQNLDPTKVHEVRVYDTSGDRIATYMAEHVSEFLFNANHVAGYYLVDVINENNKITLRYVVK